MPPNLDSRNQLLSILEEYETLEDVVPAFSRYADLADERLNAIETQACAEAATAMGDDRLLAESISLKDGPQPFKDFACDVALAGHKLSRTTTAWTWITSFLSSDIKLEFISASGDASEIILRPKTDSGTRVLVGHAVRALEGEAKSLSELQWHEFAAGMVKEPPSGRPDEQGRTECDLMAADPDDPGKRAPGVKDEQLDMIMGLEACIAAVERQTSDPVLLFQLGRVLKQAGNEELARHYFEAAAVSEHAAAFAKLGDLDAMHEDKTKLALEYYRRAARGGYEPAKQQIAMLSIGEPIDFAKDPPTSGFFKLLCLVENTSYTVGGDIHDLWMSELTAEIDLDSKTAQFDYDKIAVYNDRNLLERGKAYQLSIRDDAWLVPVADIGGEAGSYSLSIAKRNLTLSHRQPMILGSMFGIPIRASMSVTGECMQSF